MIRPCAALHRFPAAALATVPAALVLNACSFATPGFTTPPVEELPRLESAVRADSTDVDAVTALASGYVAQDRLPEALELLEGAEARLPGEPTLLAMLGLMEQEIGSHERASGYFEAYVRTSSGPVATDARARLDALRARVTRARGERLITTGGEDPEQDPDHLVLVPFSAAEEDEALATGLTWLLGASLADQRFRVSDRLLVDGALAGLDVNPGQSPTLASSEALARALGAGHVIQGGVRVDSEGRLSWDLVVVTVTPDHPPIISSIPSEGVVEDAPRLAARVGATVRAIVEGADSVRADRELEVPTTDVTALLAYARGIRAADAGDWAAARAEFEAAVSRDTAFEDAAAWIRRADAVLTTQATPLLASIETTARIGELQRAVVALRSGAGTNHQEAVSRLGAQERAEIAEILGLDRIGGGGLVGLTLESVAGGSP